MEPVINAGVYFSCSCLSSGELPNNLPVDISDEVYVERNLEIHGLSHQVMEAIKLRLFID